MCYWVILSYIELYWVIYGIRLVFRIFVELTFPLWRQGEPPASSMTTWRVWMTLATRFHCLDMAGQLIIFFDGLNFIFAVYLFLLLFCKYCFLFLFIVIVFYLLYFFIYVYLCSIPCILFWLLFCSMYLILFIYCEFAYFRTDYQWLPYSPNVSHLVTSFIPGSFFQQV